MSTASEERIFSRQGELVTELQRIGTNFDKDSAHRKTSEYLKIRLESLDSLWGEFENNNITLQAVELRSQRYFTENIYERMQAYYKDTRKKIAAYPPFKNEQGSGMGTNTDISKLNELLSRQRTNFRAFKRLISSIKVSEISEKWELEDELHSIQARWSTIDKLHLEIDNILEGEDEEYQDEFLMHERAYKKTKKELNQKLSATAHIQQSTPLLEIPTFSGKYTFWPTFFDLFNESIHNNNFLSKAQKMQHLKGKVKGEAERLIQHLNISAENYDIAWEILTHRYNNPQVLFTTQIETFLNQPSISKQTSYEIKRLYDTTTECIHAIHNLGVDTSTWDPILVHLLTKKLDSDTYSAYKEARKSPRDLASLDELMTFLESKFIALEPTHTSKKEKENSAPAKLTSAYQPNKPIINKSFKQNNYNYKLTSRGYQAAYTSTCKCPLCNFNHELYKCEKFISMPAETKMRTVEKLQLCKNCLFKHSINKCNSNKRCKECNGEHHTRLHDALAGSSHSTTSQEKPPLAITAPQPPPNKPFSKPHTANHVNADDEEVLLTTVLIKIKAKDGNYVTLRALLDQCSQISLISENAAQLLGLPRQKASLSVFGVGVTPKSSRSSVSLECKSIYDDYSFTTTASVISRVTRDLPNVSFRNNSWSHIQHMTLADPEYNVSKPIDVLLSGKIYSRVIMSGLVKGAPNEPIAQQTKLGWIVSGDGETFDGKTLNCFVVTNDLEEIAKYWEMEEIPSTASDLTKEEQYCEEHYIATTKRLEDGRYEVALPMKPDFEEKLGSSKSKATAQFKQLERKMAKSEAFSESYKQFMREYQELGHMRPANKSETPKYHLPHHGVIKEDSTTTKLRVVFNASAQTSSGLSLNDVMECGPNLQHDLPTLILNWRQYKYVITADIEKMFRQLLVRESDQHLQSIIWRESPYEPLQEYLLKTVTYGTKAAPYLAMRTLRQLAKDDALKYPLAAAALQNNFYTDDLLTGENTIEATKELQNQLIESLKSAGMNLRKWSANNNELLKDLSTDQLDQPFDFKCSESRKTLGLRWTPSTDSFMFTNKIKHAPDDKGNTKRQLLSEISKIFDPIGWLSPLTVRAKLLFQKTWSENLSWDDIVPEHIQKEWKQLRNDLQNVSSFDIPRYLGNTQQAFQLHGYSDASEKAYACAIYLVASDHKGESTSRLVVAKTKLAPLKQKVSLPRLELCGALLLAQLMKTVKASLKSTAYDVYAWTDSTVVLGWLHGDIKRWKQFVANRVQQICDVIPASKWNHVRSEDNPADCATRGSTTVKLQNYPLWWEGPEWLQHFDPSNLKNKTYEQPTLEAKKVSVHATLHQPSSNIINEIINKTSSITRATKIVAWITRFTAALRNKATEHDTYLSASEINKANQLIMKHVQANEFESDLENIKRKGHVRSNSSLANLHPFLDENGILRVGGRLAHSNISSSAKHPIILSNHSRLTDLLIHQAHITTLHGGPRLTLSYLRENYWIISGMRTIKRQLRQCVKCRRFSPESHQQIMADLPQARVTPSRPYTHTGTDFSGYVELKASKGRGMKTYKGYVAVFVCLATKAVHLELVTDLSTPAFLAAFRRFCARRGTPRRMYSDNGTNFIGAKRALDSEYQEIIKTINQDLFSKISDMNIEWSFNAPGWPSAGGLWEAAVKSFKRHLKRVLGEQKLTYEEFTTLLQQIEACLNSRPLFALTENPEDTYLTPGHFLIGESLLSRPQTEPENVNLPARWQLVQSMNKHFWKLWSSDYLQQLQVRSKWRVPTENLRLDDIVLIKDDNLPPGKWALGRVQELHPGKDGYVRVVSVKTAGNILKRPVTKLVLLPIEKSTNDDITTKDTAQQASPRTATSSGKKARGKKRNIFTNMFTLALLLFSMLISPSAQRDVTRANTTTLNDGRALYFDKVSNLQYIRDEWRLIVYYNLTGYWQALSDMETYVRHLKGMTMKSSLQYQQITNQLTHELTEIEHYNRLLQNPSKRQKRGLVNGVGGLANYLFGVLDDNFAVKYAKDIEKISYNENHLRELIKNQTVIIEAESNIIQRNEQIMNKQFLLINEHLQSVSTELNKIRTNVDNGLYITSSALAANIILENLRRIQTSLIDTVTDISHGRIDTHLLSSEQLEEQISFISGQLQGDLKIPVEKANIRDLYKLLKVFARIYKKYLIIEIKVPLISNEIYELDKIISIPKNKREKSYLTLPIYPYLAFNLRKDTAIFLTEQDLQTCFHASEEALLCTLDKPTYDLDPHQNICNLTLINAGKFITPCIYEQSPCVDRWVKLHRQNVWLYSCCNKCSIRTFCPADMAISTITGNGLLEIGQGCTLKGDSYTIHSHNNFLRKVNIQPDNEAAEVSMLNSVINSSVPRFEFSTENHEQTYHQIRDEIKVLKQASESELSIHDVHLYSVSYGTLAILLLLAGIVMVFFVRVRRKQRRMKLAASPGGEAPVSAAVTGRLALSELAVPRKRECSEMCYSVSRGVSKGTVPTKPPRSVSIQIPSESLSEIVGPSGTL